MTAVSWLFFTVTAAASLGFVIGRSTAPGSQADTPGAHPPVLRDELREAPNRDQFVLHYQPKIELGTGRVSALEALLRWHHPRRGLLTPSEFLPVAGQHDELMASLTGWVLRRALTDHMAWTVTGHDWTVAVNVFAKNLESLEFADTVSQILAEAGVEPGRLRLEVTQTESVVDTGQVAQVVGALVARGVSVCSVTAEGVESADVADWLASAGCDHAQGYLWLRPRAWVEVAQVFGRATPAT